MPNATVFFATNRRPNNANNPTEFTDEFIGDLDSLRFGKVRFTGVGLSPNRDLTELGDRGAIEVAPERMHRDDHARSVLGSDAIFGEIRQAMVDGAKDAILVVHGYDYTFRQSAARAALIGQWLGKGSDGKKMVVLMFGWPSLGAGVSPRTYADDRVRAWSSGPALARVFLKARDFIGGLPVSRRCPHAVHLIGHSSGAYAIAAGVQSLAPFVGRTVPSLFDEVILPAADIADDAIVDQGQLAPLVGACNRVTVYYNFGDKALLASKVMGNSSRLGKFGPDDRPRLPAKVVPVSVGSVVDENADPTAHQYYRINTVVRKDILAMLHGVEADSPSLRWRSFDNHRYLLVDRR